MFIFDRFKECCVRKGVKVGYIESQLGVYHGFFNNVRSGKNSISDKIIAQVAILLDTTFEYLTGKTDDPAQHDGSVAERFAISPLERKLVEAYRAHPEMWAAIHAMLNLSANESVPSEENAQTVAQVIEALRKIEKETIRLK